MSGANRIVNRGDEIRHALNEAERGAWKKRTKINGSITMIYYHLMMYIREKFYFVFRF